MLTKQFNFIRLHMRNIYQDGYRIVDGQTQTKKVIEVFADITNSTDPSGVYLSISEYHNDNASDHEDCEKLYFEMDKEEAIHTSDGILIEGYIFRLEMWRDSGSHLKGIIESQTQTGHWMDNNGGHGYELKF